MYRYGLPILVGILIVVIVALLIALCIVGGCSCCDKKKQIEETEMSVIYVQSGQPVIIEAGNRVKVIAGDPVEPNPSPMSHHH